MPIGDIGGINPTLIISCIAGNDVKKGEPVSHVKWSLECGG